MTPKEAKVLDASTSFAAPVDTIIHPTARCGPFFCSNVLDFLRLLHGATVHSWCRSVGELRQGQPAGIVPGGGQPRSNQGLYPRACGDAILTSDLDQHQVA